MARMHQGVEPTGPSGDPELYFETAPRRRARARLSARLAERSRLAVVTADAGAGKTWLMRRVLADTPADHTRCELGARDATRARDILGTLLRALGDGDSEVGLGVQLTRLGIRLAALRGHALLVIEDAQRLPAEALGVLMALAAKPRSAPRLSIVLVGRPVLLSRLHSVATAFDGKTCLDVFDLPPLSRDEVADYVHLRMHGEGGRGDSPFGEALVDWLAEASHGHPGWVDSLAAHALHRADEVTRATARRSRRRRAAAWWLASAVAAGAGGMAVASAPSRDSAMEAVWRSVEPAPEAREALAFRSRIIPIE